MDRCRPYVALITWALLAPLSASAAEVLVEAESFGDYGGWVLDPQFLNVMGSPYLLAHGLGRPVGNARTEVEFPETGKYALWVRAKDWTPEHDPGKFKVIIDGRELAPVFGTRGRDWMWHGAGTVEIKSRKVAIELRDRTGFDGRCDALFFTTDYRFVPPREPGQRMYAWRRRLLGLPDRPPDAGTFDAVVVGGGISGCSAALAAGRLGLEVALVQNRPVLGGNASSEIRIHPFGPPKWAVVDEVAGPRRGEVMRAETNITLFLGWHAFRVQEDGDRIVSVDAKNTRTNRELRFCAPVFIDCTGDGWIGYWAGADYREGREARSEFNESLAPEVADRMTHGDTVRFAVRMADAPSAFPAVPWATAVSKDFVDLRGQPSHFWEAGHWLDSTTEAEYSRDLLFRAIYGAFSTAKTKYPKKLANLELGWVSHIAARGESRRLMGDHVLTENDIRDATPFPDAVALGPGCFFCLHHPSGTYEFRDDPQASKLLWTSKTPNPIPFRCLYSRNVANLMMAGRCLSATHVAYASVKVMRTGGKTGVAVGAAAYLCKKHNTTPRGVYKGHIRELQDIVHQRGKYEGALGKAP